MKFWIVPFLSLGLCLLTACPTNAPSQINTTTPAPATNTVFDTQQTDTSARGGKTLFAVYMLGSDLEDDINPRDGKVDTDPTQGSASDDLREMVKSLQKLNGEQRKSIDLLVGFGGARKKGWKGIRYADSSCLIEDALDNRFGNATCYSKTDTQANMAKTDSLSDFITHLNTTFPNTNYGKRLLILWNHGAGHVGYGPDKNFTGPQAIMSLENIKEGLSQDKKGFDMVGFDACLMASLDVARQIKDKAQFMVASEELEPAHGWQYTDILNFIATQPMASVIDIGKHMVNSFITHTDHANTGGKTLSLLNLKDFTKLESELNTVAGTLGEAPYKSVLEALRKTEKYGKNARTKSAYAMDISHFLSNLKKEGIHTETLQNQLNQLLVYSRHDGSRPHAKGAGIFSVTNTKHFQLKLYKAERAASLPWFNFVKNFITEGLDDEEAPTVTQAPRNTPVTLEFNDEDNPQVDDFQGLKSLDTQSFKLKQTASRSCQDGLCFLIDDNKGIEDIFALRMVKTTPDTLLVLSEIPALEINENIYRTPGWDGKSLHLCADEECLPEDSALVPLIFEEFTDDDTLLFFSDGQINGQDVTFYFELDEKRDMLDAWAVPYDLDEEGQSSVTRNQIEIEPGDRVAFYLEEIIIGEEDEDNFILGEEILIDDLIDYEYYRPAGKELVTFLLAEDLKGNEEVSTLQFIP